MNKKIKFTTNETKLINKYNLNQFGGYLKAFTSKEHTCDVSELPNKPHFNRFSGDITLLNQFGTNLLKSINQQSRWILNHQYEYEYGYKTGYMKNVRALRKNVRDYDRLCYLFIKLFPKEYMILILDYNNVDIEPKMISNLRTCKILLK